MNTIKFTHNSIDFEGKIIMSGGALGAAFKVDMTKPFMFTTNFVDYYHVHDGYVHGNIKLEELAIEEVLNKYNEINIMK